MNLFPVRVAITDIVDRPELWSRADGKLMPALFNDYAERFADSTIEFKDGEQTITLFRCPPLKVVAASEEEGPYLLVDGRYRMGLASGMNATHIEVKVINPEEGETVEDRAVLEAAKANSEHGKPLTNADKRRAVKMLLESEFWKTKSANWIAKELGFSNSFVGRVKDEVCSEQTPVKGPDGKVYPAKHAKKSSQPKTSLAIVSDDAAHHGPQTEGDDDEPADDELSELEADSDDDSALECDHGSEINFDDDNATQELQDVITTLEDQHEELARLAESVDKELALDFVNAAAQLAATIQMLIATKEKMATEQLVASM
ncbi:hypothetical protein [Lacipirellula limnantheis]|uniref:ParB/Sulfiredoxin domain-containing protein n=1 Tax=Lacipirellula limnantheis TaxID=2528024 RepID=A0A517TV36_9BACT|nr:hypothetical protein [Lacipirellula limnantheis]QDT72218.1 hypothetical protein I41_13880 [Lacipirellula limnantheis]